MGMAANTRRKSEHVHKRQTKSVKENCADIPKRIEELEPILQLRRISIKEHRILAVSCFIFIFTLFFFASSHIRAQTSPEGLSVKAYVAPRQSVPQSAFYQFIERWQHLSRVEKISLFAFLGVVSLSIVGGVIFSHRKRT